MKIENQDNIDRYVLGEMSVEERAGFERQVAQDAKLQEQLEFTQHVNTAIKSRNEKLEKMEAWDDDYIPVSVRACSAKPQKGRKLFLWFSSIAGIAVLLVWIFPLGSNRIVVR